MVFALISTCLAAALGCQDRADLASCLGWKRAGYCTAAAPTMKYHCEKTCGMCGGGRPVTNPPATQQPTKLPPWTQGPPSGQCGRSPVQQSRVVNGVTAKEGAWPWIASLQVRGRHFCGGTLITPNWVLTAAHCVERKTIQYSITMGAHNHGRKEASTQTIPVKRVISHPAYSKNTLKSDFALLELSRPATLNSRVQLACLPRDTQYPKPGAKCYIAGWGSTKHPGGVATILQQARLPIVERRKCKHQLEAVCAGYGTVQDANACRGDSGGPFVCQQADGSWQLDGVASYVVEYCKYYTGFSPVAQYMPWIRSYIGGN